MGKKIYSRDQATALLGLGVAFWALARIACSTLLLFTESKPMLSTYMYIYVCMCTCTCLCTIMYHLCYVFCFCFPCMFNRLLVHFTSGSCTHADQLSVFVSCISYQLQCLRSMCVSSYLFEYSMLKYICKCIYQLNPNINMVENNKNQIRFQQNLCARLSCIWEAYVNGNTNGFKKLFICFFLNLFIMYIKYLLKR